MKPVAFILWLVVSLLAGVVGSAATVQGIDPWYVQLDKPAWTPPSWVFTPVWTLLYILMGVAAFLVWDRRGFGGAPLALTLFFVQLVLNAGWSFTFFYFQLPGLAAVHILILMGFIIATTIAFWRIERWAGILFVPYLAWVAYATTLNIGIWWLN